MADVSPAALTLSDRFIHAERMTRELIDHLERGFLPRTRELRKLVNLADPDYEFDEVEDITVRNDAGKLLESDIFTANLHEKLAAYLQSIDDSVKHILTGT
ncbi:MAG: hypothetical protein KY476_00755 [Planctomycetes bacterium]|nr:hypothetical protein [Planctomycetota bacterium]